MSFLQLATFLNGVKNFSLLLFPPIYLSFSLMQLLFSTNDRFVFSRVATRFFLIETDTESVCSRMKGTLIGRGGENHSEALALQLLPTEI